MSIDDVFPLKLGTFVSDGDRNIYAFELVVWNKPGVVYAIGRELKKRNVNILHLVHSDAERDIVSIFIVGDFTEASSKPEEILRDFKENKNFIRVSPANKVLNYLYSTSLFPIIINESRVILIGPAFINGVIHNLRKNLGSEMASNILFHLGYGIGEQGFARYAAPLNLTPEDIDVLIELTGALFVSHGWARLKGYKVEDNRITVDFIDMWECYFQKMRGEAIGSYLFKGILSAIFQCLYKRNVDVRETRCITRGDDVCRFEITIL